VLPLARRLTGLVLSLLLLSSLPVAAARAGCVCDHAHGTAAAEPHTCSAACTEATCPMHRGDDPAATGGGSHDGGLQGDRLGCSCAREALLLIGHIAPPAIVPERATVPRPLLARLEPTGLAVSPLGLAPAPPAPPPRG
jgi:hypothetical protein